MNLSKCELLTSRILYENERYYNMRNTRMDVSIALEKANHLQKYLKQKVCEDDEKEICCAICLESMENKSIVKTSCNHTFCLNCITNNTHHNKNTGQLCTICRNDIFTHTHTVGVAHS